MVSSQFRHPERSERECASAESKDPYAQQMPGRVEILRLRATASFRSPSCSAQDDSIFGLSVFIRGKEFQSPPCFAASASPSTFPIFSILTLAMRWPSISSTV